MTFLTIFASGVAIFIVKTIYGDLFSKTKEDEKELIRASEGLIVLYCPRWLLACLVAMVLSVLFVVLSIGIVSQKEVDNVCVVFYVLCWIFINMLLLNSTRVYKLAKKK